MKLDNTKKALTLVSAIVFTAGLTQMASAGELPNSNSAQTQIQFSTKSGDSTGQWQTLSNGCSYSRAQAPGYAPTWHLIVNPQAMGLPARPRGCKSLVQG